MSSSADKTFFRLGALSPSLSLFFLGVIHDSTRVKTKCMDKKSKHFAFDNFRVFVAQTPKRFHGDHNKNCGLYRSSNDEVTKERN